MRKILLSSILLTSFLLVNACQSPNSTYDKKTFEIKRGNQCEDAEKGGQLEY